MKIAFVNQTPLVYTVDTPYQAPLGGSESALCYVAEALAQRGHDVRIFTRIQTAQHIRGVMHLPDADIQHNHDLDVLVIQNTPSYGKDIKPFISEHTKLVLWLQHAHDQPAVSCLQDPRVSEIYSSIVLISHWQRHHFLQHFPLDAQKCFILRNAIAPAFENMFFSGEKISMKKINPPILAYTSTPFRGLDRLLSIFPLVRKDYPDVRLQVFSSMKVYQVTSDEDQKYYGDVYEQCRHTDGVELFGSLSQPQLAQRLKPVSILAYPNTFQETGCTSVLEAMGAGCHIITSTLGALPETSSGFGDLIDPTLSEDAYIHEFTSAILNKLRLIYSKNTDDLDDILARQTYFINNAYTWTQRAEEWEHFLLKMC